jgi:hypothetical protein
MGIFRRQPLTPAQVTVFEEAGRKQRESAAKSPVSLGQRVGLPRDAAEYILKLEARIEQLERKVAALEGPAHLQKVEKR